MSEINVAAVLTPKPGKFDEVSSNLILPTYSYYPQWPWIKQLNCIQVATLVTEVIKQVQEHEPDTLLYYAFQIKDKDEIVIVERYVRNVFDTGRLLSPRAKRETVPRHILLPIASLPHKPLDHVLIGSRYKNQSAVQAHVKAPYFRSFAGKLPTLLAKPSELRAGGFLSGSRGVSRL
jgi:quinol monooxygenase YgiN